MFSVLLLYALICMLVIHCDPHYCTSPFSRSNLIILAMSYFSFHLFSPLENGCSLYKLALTPSNLLLPALLLSHCPSHQWPALLPALPRVLSLSRRIARTTDFSEEHPHHENRRGNEIENCVGCFSHADYCSTYLVYILNFFLL